MNNSSTIVDPLSRLPIETFTHLFPFLPIFDIAKSSAVSRSWREAILSDSTLHQEVDLTRLKSEDTNVILVHLDRLSSRSLHRLVKVSLDLDYFYRSYIRGIDYNAGYATDSLVRSLSRSSDSLKRISLKIDDSGKDKFGYLFYRILGAVLKFPGLKAIFIEVDQYIEFQVGEDVPSSKVFSVTRAPFNESFENFDEYFVTVLKVIEAAAAFAGNKLTKLSLNWVSLRAPDGRLTIELIRNHSCTLQNLFIEADDLDLSQMRGLLCASASCPNLTHLTLILEGNGDDEVDGAGPVVLEEGLKCCNLKKLELETDIRLDWNSWSRWCGDSLQQIWISIGSTLSTSPAPFISKSSSTLRNLKLDFSQGEVEETFANHLPPFPNLSEVYLKGLSSSSLKLFSKLDVKNLLRLTIWATEETANETFNCLHSLLKNYSSTLRFLVLHDIGNDRFTSPTTTQLHFSQLYSMLLYSCHPDFLKWLSTLSYPALIGVHFYGSADSDEAKARFKMNSPNLKKWTFERESSPF